MSTPPDIDPIDPQDRFDSLDSLDPQLAPSHAEESASLEERGFPSNEFPAESVHPDAEANVVAQSSPHYSAEKMGDQAFQAEFSVADPAAAFFQDQSDQEQSGPDQSEPAPLFQSFSEPPIVPATRIPNFGDLGLLGALIFLATAASVVLIWSALHFHVYGVTSLTQAATEIHYALGSEVSIYLLTFLGCLVFFPMLWHKGFFAGLQWNAATAIGLRGQLFSAAFVCFLLALVNGWLMPGPDNAPIDQIFRAPGAAWLLFAFGVTVAPFFEEIAFRGFLLPALCTAWDWSIERGTLKPAPALGANGHPQWSTFAMVIGSILTSVPFAWMHAEQTGYSLGPFLLLVCVSLVLCWARLKTRSLAASVLVHASYNFLLFSLMLLGTSGFKHLDKM